MSNRALSRFREELEKELKENILSWWMGYTPDRELGGFHGHIDHLNQVMKGAGKGAVLNARILWTFSAAYRMYNQPEYLETARRAYAYIISYFTDKKYGGVYWELEPDGSVRSSRKQIYATAFTIYGLAKYHMACGDDRALKIAKGLFRDWKALEDLRLSEKDQNESKTMNTHLHILEAYGNLFRVWKDPGLKEALKNLIKLFLEHFVDRERNVLNLFFDDNWNLKSTLISFGHDIECSWLLHEAAALLGDPGLIKECAELAVNMAHASEAGQAGDGGLHYEFFPESMELDSDKHWWPQAEAMVGYYNAFQFRVNRNFWRDPLEAGSLLKNISSIISWANGSGALTARRTSVKNMRHC